MCSDMPSVLSVEVLTHFFRIRDFVVQFGCSFLIPHLEHELHSANAQISNSKKGNARSIFSVTKKWLSANNAKPELKPGTHALELIRNFLQSQPQYMDALMAPKLLLVSPPKR